MNQYLNYKKLLQDPSYPYAFVDMDALDKNIEENSFRAKKVKIRIASKSVRCPAIMQHILEKDEKYQGIMAFHGKEAVYLSQNGFDDILLGYPVVDKKVLEEMGQEIKKGKTIYPMVDMPFHLDLLEEVGKKLNVIFPVCLDLDLSIDFGPLHFGVWRSALVNEKALEYFLEALKKCKHIELKGLMGYEAQIAGIVDNAKEYGVKNQVIRMLKKRSIPKIKTWRGKALEMIKDAGIELELVNGGGTGSIETTIEESEITEVTVGSGFYNSHLFDNYGNFQLEPALMYAIQIVRNPKANIFTCHGGGYIASGGVEKLKAPKIHLPKNAFLDSNEGAGEVQTPVYYKGDLDLKIGDPIFMRHAKAGEVCEHFNELILLNSKGILQTVPTYRGLGQCFL